MQISNTSNSIKVLKGGVWADTILNFKKGGTFLPFSSNTPVVESYQQLILGSNPSAYWTLGDELGSSAFADSVGDADAVFINTTPDLQDDAPFSGSSPSAGMGVSKSARYDGTVISGYPFSVECLFRMNVTGNCYNFSLCNSSLTNHWVLLGFESFGTQLVYSVNNAGTLVYIPVQGIDHLQWNHLVGVSSGSNDHKFYINGVLAGSSNVNTPYPTISNVGIGQLARSGTKFENDHNAAHVAVYDFGLTQEQITERYQFITGFETEVLDLQLGIAANSGTVTTSTLSALNTLVSDLKSESLWDKFVEICPFVGNSLNAAATKLKYVSNQYVTYTGVTTYSEAGGVSVDTNSRKINLNFNPSGVVSISTGAAMIVYKVSSTRLDMGALSGNGNDIYPRMFMHAPFADNNVYVDIFDGKSIARMVSSGTGGNGVVIGSRENATNGHTRVNGTLYANRTDITSTFEPPSANLVIGKVDLVSNTNATLSPVGISAIAYGLTPAESATVSTIFETFETAIGRSTV